MQNISKDELKAEKTIFYNKIKEGSLFIHPTDTIYGIGCNATNHKSVYKVREAKERYTRATFMRSIRTSARRQS